MNKTKSEIREEVLDRLAISLGINITDEGSIAVAIVDAFVEEVYYLYQELEMLRSQAYLSTSYGYNTDLIAQLVGVDRTTYETDDDLKIRAADSVQLNATGNRLAIEQKALSVPGVADIDYRPYGKGAGSFVLYVYPTEGQNQLMLLDSVTAALQEVVADGIYYEVKQPRESVISMSVILQFDNQATLSERQVAKTKVRSRIITLLNGLKRNDILRINEVVQTIMSTDNHILDVNFAELKVNNIQKHIANTFPANDEHFVAGNISVS